MEEDVIWEDLPSAVDSGCSAECRRARHATEWSQNSCMRVYGLMAVHLHSRHATDGLVQLVRDGGGGVHVRVQVHKSCAESVGRLLLISRRAVLGGRGWKVLPAPHGHTARTGMQPESRE